MDTLTPLTPLTILAVEDNPADIDAVQWVLTAHALTYDLQVIENANQAFSFFDQLTESEHTRCPDILLLDLNLSVARAQRASPSNVHPVLDFLGHYFRSRDVVTIFVCRSLRWFLLGTARMLLVTS
jgi:CheY-like chemotaxis protein